MDCDEPAPLARAGPRERARTQPRSSPWVAIPRHAATAHTRALLAKICSPRLTALVVLPGWLRYPGARVPGTSRREVRAPTSGLPRALSWQATPAATRPPRPRRDDRNQLPRNDRGSYPNGIHNPGRA